MTRIQRPDGMFDRYKEWHSLSRFVTDPNPGATLGVVSGRRRQGKSYLLQAACQGTGGFYFAADQTTSLEGLQDLGAALADHLGMAAPFNFTRWHEAIDVLLSLGRDKPIPVVLDEFPYLVRANPSIPSIIQNAYAPLRAERQNSQTRLLLCGSAMSFMGKLLSGHAPLRGRAGLEMVVHTLNFQLAAQFWNLEDPALAVKVNAIVGGTPAYRREFVQNDAPTSPDDFDSWVVRTVLNRESPLFREARYLLAEELDTHDSSLYLPLLAAIAKGNTSRGSIASYIGRKTGDLTHPLTVLEDAGLVTREADAFRSNRTVFHIAEPLITFYHAIMRPNWSVLEQSEDTTRFWESRKAKFVGNVVGQHFEQLCRYWTLHLSPADLFDDLATRVASGTVNDPARKTSHEIDVAVFGSADNGQETLLGIGEVKWGKVMDLRHVERLRRIRNLLSGQDRPGAEKAKLICYSGAGFSDELKEAQRQDADIILISLAELYNKSSSANLAK